jgi:hypothetical protein
LGSEKENSSRMKRIQAKGTSKKKQKMKGDFEKRRIKTFVRKKRRENGKEKTMTIKQQNAQNT